MIVQKTWPQYIAVRALIVMMRDLGLLGLTYFYVVFALGGVKAIAHPVSIFIEVIAAIEILFYLLFFLPYKWYLQSHKPYQPPRMTRSQRARLFYKALSLVPDGEEFVRKWMLNVHMEDIRRENLKDWLLWALFEQDNMSSRPTKHIDDELEQYIDDAEEKFGIKLRSGRGSAEALRLMFDPVIIQHRSLFYYMVIGLFDNLMALYLLTQGYRYYKQPLSTFFKIFPVRFINLFPFTQSAADEMSYWYRPHKSTTKRPIVFIHGLGVGLIPYIFWLHTIPKDVGILAVEMLPISSRVTTYPLASTPELCKMIAKCVAQQRALQPTPGAGESGTWNDFVLIGNSYGTLLMGQLLQRADFAPRVAATVLIDPVSLLLHLPDVAFNFTRREPTPSVRGRTGHGNEWEIWWASATDAGTAYTLARRLCWRESLMWREMLTPSLRNVETGYYASGSPEEIAIFGNGVQVGMRSTVILGGEDCVTAPKPVASYVYSGDVKWSLDDLETWKRYQWTGKEELELMFLDGKDHGQGIMVPYPYKPIQNVIETYCQRNDGFEPFGDKFIGGPESIYGMREQTPEVVELKSM
ncbi:alpha/beta hydrolase fold family [Colletotrichum tofieldiae]|uniref:Alpha/beta hydrolase fold family n=1 Tax=Colletotrichum tofieldiae TaxID=708197 RepID=A0A166XUG3_9PEZI|nr:alpha/beta hydrolase fold family [Colletotrichum tofieldiae]GKT90732.1 alpha/beta hydrolase fold family [Colletotrichum tofieldiae]